PICSNHLEFVNQPLLRKALKFHYKVGDRWRVYGKNGGTASQGLADMQASHVACPTEEFADSVIRVGHVPMRIVDDHSIGNSLHHVFALVCLLTRHLRQAVNAEKQARILNCQSDLLGELLEYIYLFDGKSVCSPVIDLTRSHD